MEEEKVFLLLTDTGTLFTRMIKLYTRKPFNHASLSLDADLSEVYSFGRKNTKNPFIGGFVRENVQEDLFIQARCAIYRCNVTKEQKQRLYQFIKKIETQEHYRYNLLGLFAIMFNMQLNRKNAYFCSQFVAAAFDNCDIVRYRKPLPLVTPFDLQEAENFTLVYQGRLADYYQAERKMDITKSQVKPVKI